MLQKSKSGANFINTKSLRELIVQESRFISNVIDRLPIPSHAEDNTDEVDSVEVKTGSHTDDGGPSGTRKASRAQSLEELALKLKELHGKKPSYKNKLAKKGLKNKLRKKKKNEERLLNKKLMGAQKSGKLKIELSESEKKVLKPAKPVFNSEGKLVFSKFDFSEIGKKNGKKEERDPKKILKQMEKQQEKLNKLQSAGDSDKVKELQEKQAWMLALKKSHGVKVKDDPELLKKSVKRIEQRKKQSAKKWKAREETVKKQQEDRQKKRTHSIQQRKDRNKQTKVKKNIKKGRVMPGF